MNKKILMIFLNLIWAQNYLYSAAIQQIEDTTLFQQLIICLDKGFELFNFAINKMDDNTIITKFVELDDKKVELLLSVMDDRERALKLTKLIAEEKSKEECAICLTRINNSVKIFSLNSTFCLHNFHKGCLDQWLLRKRFCPICQAPLVNDLFDCIRARDLRRMMEYIQKGINLNLITLRSKQTLLMAAIQTDNIEMVQLLLDHGANVNQTFSCDSPLFLAVKNKNFEMASLLIRYKADVNYIDPIYNQSPLSVAAKKGSREIVDLLLQNGAIKTRKDVWDKTAFDHATSYDIRKLLE